MKRLAVSAATERAALRVLEGAPTDELREQLVYTFALVWLDAFAAVAGRRAAALLAYRLADELVK